jgi:hypothetical protein
MNGQEQTNTSTNGMKKRPKKSKTSRAIASARIQMALAKSFVFNAHRANRICHDNNAALALDRFERTRFMKAAGQLAVLRDVNEHGITVTVLDCTP